MSLILLPSLYPIPTLSTSILKNHVETKECLQRKKNQKYTARKRDERGMREGLKMKRDRQHYIYFYLGISLLNNLPPSPTPCDTSKSRRKSRNVYDQTRRRRDDDEVRTPPPSLTPLKSLPTLPTGKAVLRGKERPPNFKTEKEGIRKLMA